MYLFILKTFRLLRDHDPGKLLLILALTLLLGGMSGFSIVMLIPLLQLLSVGDDKAPEGIALFIQDLAGRAGIDLTISNILIFFLIMLTLTSVLQYRKAILDARYQQTFIYTLRRRLFRKIIMADWYSLSSRSKTNHLQVLTREVPNLAQYYFYYLRLMTTVLTTLAYIIYALLISASITLIIIIFGLIFFLVMRRYLRRSFQYGKNYAGSYHRLLKYINDFWQTVKIAKVHNSEEYYYAKFDEASSSLLDTELRMQRNWSMPQLIQKMAGLVVLVIVVWTGYRWGSVPMASFVILILLFSRVFPQFVALNTDLNMIMSNIASVRLVMQLDEDLPDPETTARIEGTPIPLKYEIRLEGIGFAYPDGAEVFRDFSGVIKSNRITGIIGSSGQGKTTLIDLIAGLQKPQAGRVVIDGMTLDESLLPGWRAGIGYLPQTPFFIDGTLRENLVWDSRGNIPDTEILEVLRQVNALNLVQRYRKGLDAFVVNYPFSFSGGECQRLALARVLLRRPSVLLLDEATSSLDAENEATVMEVLARLKERVTIVFVTHRESVTRWFDEVIKI